MGNNRREKCDNCQLKFLEIIEGNFWVICTGGNECNGKYPAKRKDDLMLPKLQEVRKNWQ